MASVAIIGTGYVGLVSGACLADFGNTVICVDIDRNKIECLKNGEIPIYEPGLEDVVVRNTMAQRLRFTDSLPDAVANSEVVFCGRHPAVGRWQCRSFICGKRRSRHWQSYDNLQGCR